MSNKLYILTRRDLPIGYQAVQAAHALREFSNLFPDADREWFGDSNSIIILTCSSYKEFQKLLHKADMQGFQYASFKEPDIAHQITAAAFVPHDEIKHFLRHCQLLGGPSVVPESPKTLLDYVHLMRHTAQGTQTVWEHGKSVKQKFMDLLSGQYKDWPRIETVKWLDSARTLPYPIEEIETYCLFHDIGKTITADGTGRFPGHAQASYDLWMKLDGREHIARWMLNDMAIHTMDKEGFS